MLTLFLFSTQNVVARNTVRPEIHNFVAISDPGMSRFYFVHQPSFHMASGRCQLIFTANVSREGEVDLHALSSTITGPARTFMRNIKPISIDEITDGFSFDGEVCSDLGTYVPSHLRFAYHISHLPQLLEDYASL